MDSEMFMKIILALISILSALITGIVIPYLKSKTTLTQQENIMFWVNIAVSAAEQIFAGPKMGAEKKAYVLKFLQDKGIELSEEELNVLLESAVKELNLVQKTATEIK